MTTSDPTPVDLPLSAYDLLTRPTLEITDAEALLIIADLRKRRQAYVESNGKKRDEPHKEKRSPATAEEKAANTADLLANLGL